MSKRVDFFIFYLRNNDFYILLIVIANYCVDRGSRRSFVDIIQVVIVFAVMIIVVFTFQFSENILEERHYFFGSELPFSNGVYQGYEKKY